MHLFSSVDWGFLEAFFGEHGKLITAAIALVCALIGLFGGLFKYLYARILEKERAAARRDVQKLTADLQNQRALVREQQLALKAREEDLDNRDRLLRKAVDGINLREGKLQKLRDAFSGKEH